MVNMALYPEFYENLRSYGIDVNYDTFEEVTKFIERVKPGGEITNAQVHLITYLAWEGEKKIKGGKE